MSANPRLRTFGVAGVLLAAGAGTRFGGGKLLANVSGGVPMCVAAYHNLREAVQTAIAVVRTGDTEVAQALAAAGANVVECASAHEGMGASLACGVAAIPDVGGWVIALGDMPFVRPASIAAVVHRLRTGARIAAPSYRGERGHPVGFSYSLFDELVACGADTGARGILQAHARDLELVAVDDPGVLLDIDTREQLRAQSAG